MDLYEALYTTRAMRRVRPDPVPTEVIQSMLDAAIRAPSGGNSQNWRFVVVTDPDVRRRLGELYRDAFAILRETVYKDLWERARQVGDEASLRVQRSSQWLAEHAGDVPLWLLAFSRNDPSGASIYPAVWSAMLAARGHGVGTCLTTILAHFKSAEVFELLGVPDDRGWVLNAAVSAGYPLGRWGIAARKPVQRVTYQDRWGEPVPWEVNEPLYRPSG